MSLRALWLVIYFVALGAPFLVIDLTSRTEGRTLMHELGSGLGIAVLVILALQLVLPSRLRLFAGLGADVAIRLHRRLATVVLTLTAAHIIVIVLADPARLALLRFVEAPLRAQAAMLSVLAMLLLFGTSMARRRIRLPYTGWRGLHLVLGGLALGLAIVHMATRWGADRYNGSHCGVAQPRPEVSVNLYAVPVGRPGARRSPCD